MSGDRLLVLRLRLVAVGAVLLTVVAAVLPEFAVGQGGAVPEQPARPVVDAVGHDFVTLSWDDPGDATVTGYQILRRNRDVDALGEFTVVEDDTASTDTVYTDRSVDAATRYGYRIKARNAHGLSPRSRSARVETLVEPPSLAEVWSAVLDSGAEDGTVGFSRWARLGSLSPDRFDVDGSEFQVLLLAEIAGGLFLGLRSALETDFVLEVGGEQFTGLQSLVPAGLPTRGAFWWPTGGILSAGAAVDVSLSVGGGLIGARGTAPPGAWFSDVPEFHDGATGFSLQLNFDEADVEVIAGSMADALTVSGGSLVTVSEVSPVGRAWEIAVEPDGPGDVSVSLSAASDCVSALSVCSADGRMLRNTPQAAIEGPGDATRLASFEVGTLALSPAFDPEVTLYSATAPAGTQQITVDAEPAESSSVATVSPADTDPVATGHQVALAQGAQTVIAVTVTAADGAERTYWAVVDVVGPGPSEQGSEPPKLNGLAVDGVDDLGFDPATTRYETTADADADTATIITGLHDADATVQVITVHGDDPTLTPDLDDSDPVESGHQSGLADDGDTLVLVIVTSADGLRQQVYVILISQQSSGATPRYQQAPAKQSLSQVSLKSGLLRDPVISTRHTNLPTLDSLTLTDTTLSPAFAAGTATYTAEVASDVATVTVTPTAPAGTTFVIAPADADGVTEGHQVNLAEPSAGGDPSQTVIAVIVRNAQNAVNAYTITVTRDSALTEVLPAGCELEHLQDQGDGTRTASGRWGPSCRSILEYHEWVSHLPSGIKVTGYAHFYELTLSRISDVEIRLHTYNEGWGETSTHTTVRTDDGTLLEHYYDNVNYNNWECINLYALPCPDHGRLKATLEAGSYIIEAVQHYSSDRRRRNFTIEVAVSDYIDASAPLLASLTVDGTSVPSFSSETFLYEIDRPGAQVTVAAEAVTADPAFEVSISPADADTNTAGHQVDVAEYGLTEVTVSVSDDGAGLVHDYTVVMSGDHAAGVGSTGAVSVGGSTRARVDSANDRDWFAVDLVAGTAYVIELAGADAPPGTPAAGTLEDPKIWGITVEAGTAVANTSDDDSGYGNNSAVWYRPTAAGKYFVIVGAAAAGTGTYELAVSEVADDFAASTSTTGVVTVGGADAAGEIEIGDDQDWFEVTLAADERYWFMARGASTGIGTLTDPHLYGVFDSTGTLVADTADADSGVGTDAFVVFEPATAGSYYVAVGTGDSGRGTYELTAGTDTVTADTDDYSEDTSTTGTVTVDGAATSAEVDFRGDRDWLAVTLAADTTYWLEVQGAPSGNGTLADPHLHGVMDSTGTMVADTADADNGHGNDAELVFEVSTAGTYYVNVGSSEVGTYQVTVTDVSDGFTDDFTDGTGTTGTVAVGGSADGQIQYLGDRDWFKVTLEADQEYFVLVEGRGRGRGTLPDPHLYGLYDSTGSLVDGTEDADSGAERDGFALVTVDTDGTYYVAAGSAGGERGTYRVMVVERPSVGTSEHADRPGDWPAENPGDHADDLSTGGYLALDDTVLGRANEGDRDWYWVYLEAGTRYRFELERRCEGWWWGCDGGRMPHMLMRDDDGNALVGLSADDNASVYDERRFYTAERTGMHVLEVWSELPSALYTWVFSYTLEFAEAGDG